MPSGIWTIDPARSTVGWSVKHLGVTTVHGSATTFGGTLSGGRASGTVAADSLRTDDPKRDEYVRSPEFLDAEDFPELRFSAELTGGDAIAGDLTIRDTTLPLTLQVERMEADADEVQLELTGTVLRRPYGLKFPHAFGAADRSVADEVELALDLVLVAG